MLWLWKKHYDYESDEQLDEKPDEQTVEQPDKQPDITDMLNLENEELAAQKKHSNTYTIRKAYQKRH